MEELMFIALIDGLAWALDTESLSLWYAEPGAKFQCAGDRDVGIFADAPGIVKDFFWNYRRIV